MKTGGAFAMRPRFAVTGLLTLALAGVVGGAGRGAESKTVARATGGMAVWTATGGQPGAVFGNSVSSAGDVNGDGLDDVLVGAPNYDGGQTDEGRVFVYLGTATGLVASAPLEVDQARANFGHCVASAGDVNGDGYGDVIVGAPKFDFGQADEGAAFVYLGSPAGLSGTYAWYAQSNQQDAQFGRSVAGAGDVNGDGCADVVIGAYHYDAGETDEGGAFLYLGSASGLLPGSSWVAQGNQTRANFGYTVACAGDVNLDGFADVIVGAPDFDGDQPDEGRAFLYAGSPQGLTFTEEWTVDGDQDSAYFALSVAGAGDVDGDGYSDVVVGADHYSAGQTLEGRALVYLGSASGLGHSASRTVDSNQAFSILGLSVAGAGDFDGDGYADIILGAPKFDSGENDEGRAFVHRGFPGGLTSYPVWTAQGDQEAAFFGFAVATAGDVNGDDVSDIIVGAKFFDGVHVDEGQVSLYFGSPASVSVPRAIGSPSGLRLTSIYPNPITSHTTIRYVLAKEGTVSLALHDAQGRRAAQLFHGAQVAGEHELKWDLHRRLGGEIGLGVYWLRLESRGEADMKKVVCQ